MTRIRSDPPKQPSAFQVEERRLFNLRKKGPEPDVIAKASSPRIGRWAMLVKHPSQPPVKKSRITLAKVWK